MYAENSKDAEECGKLTVSWKRVARMFSHKVSEVITACRSIVAVRLRPVSLLKLGPHK